MSQPLRKLIQAITPNFSLKELRQMVPWFDAVSDGINQSANIIAMAHVDSGGTFQTRFGFDTPLSHPSPGNYIFTFSDTQVPSSLVLLANITGQGTPAGALNIYPNLQDPDTMVVNIWQIAHTTAARTQVDAEFFLAVLRLPTDNTTT